MSRTKLVLFFAALACLLLAVRSQAAAPRAYVKIEGTKQGTFKGESVRLAGKDYIAVLAFNYEATSPRDPSTGAPTGKRQHMPVVITKTLDSTSPQIYQALVTNETLKQVTIEFVTTSTDGKELAYYVITLKNASVSDLHQHMDLAGATAAGSSTDPLEDVSFTFEEMTVTSNVGQTSATDSWTATP